ncbi:MAG: YfcE family phosphodiesterase [bacterium]|nr:YfcE family phosphodiesterase [bacterium]
MKIAIMSDSHENWTKLTKAIDIANKENCTHLLFAGDLIAPPGIVVLEKFNGKIHFVWGNNEGEKTGLTRKMNASQKITLEGDIFESEIHGIKIFMNHYPRIVELAAKSGDFDLCIHGHSHEYREEAIGSTILINPGEIQGYLTGKVTFIIFDCETKKVKRIEL